MNPELFLAFILISVVLFITPGPNVTLVVATGATFGSRAALVTVMGATLGNGILVGAIAFGLHWILASSEVLFEVIRWAGAAYLVWLGIQAWRNAGRLDAQQTPPSGRVHLWRGLAVAISNPKTIAFFTAFLPQFVDPTLPAAPQLAAMCIMTVVLSGSIDAAWASAAGYGRAWFMKRSRARALGYVSSALLVGGGIWLMLVRRPA